MSTQTLSYLLIRDLGKLKDEINAYDNEALIWRIKEGIKNSPGNLCLHICGNLQHFIGAVLGNTGYKRNRDTEFSAKNISRNSLVAELDKTSNIVKSVLENFSDDDLDKEYPIEVLDRKWSNAGFMIHLIAHLNYHLGQVNYHRRLINEIG